VVTTGIDFASMGMQVMRPDAVAVSGVLALGRRSDVIPGFRNRVMTFMMTRLLPRSVVG